MHIALARFPAELDRDFRDWFAWANDQLSETAGLKNRGLLRAVDGSYAALMEHESADRGPQATRYAVVVDFASSGSCCGNGNGANCHEGTS